MVTPIDIAWERIQSRGNDYELGISMKYLEQLEFYYGELLKAFSLAGTQVHLLDGTLPKKKLAAQAADLVKLCRDDFSDDEDDYPSDEDDRYSDWSDVFSERYEPSEDSSSEPDEPHRGPDGEYF